MTDAGEKLRDRIVNSSSYKPNDLNDLCEIVRAELERAAGIAELYNEGFTGGGTGGQWTCMQRIASAIRKLKE